MDNLTRFINAIEHKVKQSDSQALVKLLTQASGYKPYLDGSIIGFGRYHYQYASGRSGQASVIAFSPRKQNIAIYIMPGFSQYQSQLSRLGKYKLGKSCLYINKLADVDLAVLADIAALSVKEMQNKYRCSAS
ncbi:protein of unknown function (DU1801) [Colwellia chukchiensis]|uniref:YdhG-like domain-containing protein n=1 Tax=Colwellia chukchiensis TaxID=641665 RepID=A0A1H7LYZ1_9GAMM|nr:DUF1801 domain-containing protein [Colwellia chukchiensis]SEL03958.1 protein of unknown function (DU1801) [Colwellia chukchiensis]